MRFPAERIAARGADAEAALREWLATVADKWAERHFHRLTAHLLKAALKEGYTLDPSNRPVADVAAATLYGGRHGHG